MQENFKYDRNVMLKFTKINDFHVLRKPQRKLQCIFDHHFFKFMTNSDLSKVHKYRTEKCASYKADEESKK